MHIRTEILTSINVRLNYIRIARLHVTYKNTKIFSVISRGITYKIWWRDFRAILCRKRCRKKFMDTSNVIPRQYSIVEI